MEKAIQNLISGSKNMAIILILKSCKICKIQHRQKNSIYDEGIEVGFTEGQALDIAKSYILEFCSLEWVPL